MSLFEKRLGQNIQPAESDSDPSNQSRPASVPRATWRTRLSNWAFSSKPADQILNRRAAHLVDMLQMGHHMQRDGVYVDIGSGTGHNSVRIAQVSKGLQARFICIEPVTKPTRRVLRRMAKRTDGLLQFVRAIGNRLPLSDGHADGVSIFFVLHHIPYDLQLDVLEEVRRVLKPGGLIFLWEDTPENSDEYQANEIWDRRLNFESKHEPHYYRRSDEWQALLESYGFDLVDRVYYEDQSKRRNEGLIRHTGLVCRCLSDESQSNVASLADSACLSR